MTGGPLTVHGAIIDVRIGVGPRRAALLRRNGLRVPPPVLVRAQIDTGSGPSGFDPRVFRELELPPVGTMNIVTPSTPHDAPHEAELFDIQLDVIANGSAHPFLNTRVIASACFHPATEDGVEGLLGRDVLDLTTFNYYGVGRQFAFNF